MFLTGTLVGDVLFDGLVDELETVGRAVVGSTQGHSQSVALAHAHVVAPVVDRLAAAPHCPS